MHWRLLLVWPVLISVPRLVLLIKEFGLGRLDSPKYWMKVLKQDSDRPQLKIKLESWYSLVYEQKSCEIIVAEKLKELDGINGEPQLEMKSMFN